MKADDSCLEGESGEQGGLAGEARRGGWEGRPASRIGTGGIAEMKLARGERKKEEKEGEKENEDE